MKKVLLALGICALATFSFSSCQKELKNADEENKLVTVSFTAEKAGTETKTAAVPGETSVSYIWTNEDVNNIKLFIVGSETKQEEGKEPYEVETLTQVVNPTIEKVSDEKLTITAQVAPNATYKFRAVLAGAWTNDGKKPRISDEQNPSETNYDPSADILVSDDMEVSVIDSGEETVSTNALEMVFRRQVVVNKMMLRGIDTENNTVQKVVITSDKYLAGYINTRTANGDKKAITLNYNNATAVDDFPVYFTTIPGTGHSLTIEVTTDKFIYSKTFAEGTTIDFSLGKFNKFIVGLSNGTANTALSVPVEDSMDWAKTGGSDATAELTAADLTVLSGDKKIYESVSKAYKGGDGLKFGTKDVTGSITTNSIDLSSSFFVAIDAKAYGTDASKLKILIDGEDVYTSASNLTSGYETYYVNCDAATPTSKVTITTTKRGYVNNLIIGSGVYVAPPAINVTSNNPLEVSNVGGNQTITYNIENPTSGVSLSATTEATWITDLNYTVLGQVSFNVAAQVAGAEARSAEIVLSYTGAKSKTVIINQAAGAGGATTYSYSFTNSSWNADRDGTSENWSSGKNGSGYSNSGIQVSTSASGANGTSPYSFTDIEEITITYCTNASKGVGVISVTVGDGSAQTFNVTAPSSNGTTPKTATLSFSPKESGKVKIEVTCTTNSLYLIGASIKAASIDIPTPSITVETNDASNTSSENGTSATLNGTVSLLNGATNDKVTEAGFYYKLSNEANYTKVTLSAAPTTTTSFSFDLTGLTKDAEYTYHAYAIYNNGDEVVSSDKTFTPTKAAVVTKGDSWTSGIFDETDDIESPIDEVTISTDIDPSSCETSNLARGLAWSSGKSPVLTLSGYKGGIESVALQMSTNGNSTSVVVSCGGTILTSQTITSGTAAANSTYTFTFPQLKTGDITITVTNTASKSVWIKSISIN